MGADAGAADRPPNTPDGVRGAKEPDDVRAPNDPDGVLNTADGDRDPNDPDGVLVVVACSGGLIGQGDEVSDFAVTGGFVVMGSDDGAAAGVVVVVADSRAWVRRPMARIFGSSCVRTSSTEAAALPVPDGLVT